MKGNPGDPATTEQNIDHTGGFAKVFRKLWDHPLWQDPYRLRAWLDCILLAYWRDTRVMWRGRRVTVRRGSFLTSIRILEKRWGRSRQFVADFLDDGEKYGELAVERSRDGCHVTVVNYDRYHGLNDTKYDTYMTPRCHPDDTIEEVQELQEENQPPVGVDKSVDNFKVNPSMPRRVAEVVEAFQQTTADPKAKIRPPSVREKMRVEGAIEKNGGDHVPIREFVRECTRTANASGTAPTSVCYGIQAWENAQLRQESESRRPAARRESQDRPLKPTYHERAQPSPRHELTDEENENALGSIRGVLKKLCLPSTGGK